MERHTTVPQRNVFWAIWVLLSLASTTLLGPLSPFLGFNAMVYILGFRRFGESGVETATVAVVSGGLMGLILGLVGLAVLQRYYGHRETRKKVSVVVAFVVATLLSVGIFILVSSGTYLGLVPLCIGGILVWGMATALLMTIPSRYGESVTPQNS